LACSGEISLAFSQFQPLKPKRKRQKGESISIVQSFLSFRHLQRFGVLHAQKEEESLVYFTCKEKDEQLPIATLEFELLFRSNSIPPLEAESESPLPLRRHEAESFNIANESATCRRRWSTAAGVCLHRC